MARTHPVDMPWVIVQVKGQPFALPSADLRELVAVDQITPVARTPPHLRGVVNLRGKVIPVIDLRRRLGLASIAEETTAFCELMQQREQDHRKWLAELEASVKERRPFTLTTDPHQCAFGRWYDTYKSDNGWISMLLRKFDSPHQRIHKLGVEVEALKGAGRFDEALQLMARSQDSGLNLMLALFAELKVLTRAVTRETLAVLSVEGCVAAVTVDQALSVEKLTQLEELPAGAGARADGLVFRVGRRAGKPQPVMLLECEHLVHAGRLATSPTSSSC